MRTLATQHPTNDVAKQKKNRARSRYPSPLSIGMPLLQRKCACGGGCPRCQDDLGIQTKLKIGEPGDKHEQEADRIADEVMRMPEPQIQRQPTKNNPSQVLPTLSSEIQGLNSSGQSLPESVRNFFEPRFNRDLSQVRIHTNSRSAMTAKALQARAFTVGRDILFGAGQYAPEGTFGRRLLAHELAHVIQQSQEHSTPRIQLWSYGTGTHNTSGGNTLREMTRQEREGANGMDRAMTIVERLVNGTDFNARQCRQWFTDNCLDPRTLVEIHNRAVIWMWRRADGSGGLGLTDGGNRQHHAVTEQLFDRRSLWALAATIIHEYWHDCDTGAADDIGDEAKAACGRLPNI